ncbi:MAG: methylated-DNA--[protein]-cysteine S-methyltransferase [Phycisphaerae bacterium]
MYSAVRRRDASFVGVFVVAVRTTGVFCRPGCTAKTPRRENVEFFTDARAALRRGYRPCRRCRPLEGVFAQPAWVQRLLRLVDERPEERFTAARLRAEGVEPARAARYFRRNFGMTFQAFARSRRVVAAARAIRTGKPVGWVAIRSGYQSESGFRDAFRKLFGESPKRAHACGTGELAAQPIASPLGELFAVAADEGICLLEFADRRALRAQLETLGRRVPGPVLHAEHRHLSALRAQLGEYFAGARREFNLPILIRGTPFQEQVWAALRSIPFGQTRSYAEIARQVGRPTAVRAVARANGENRLAILIPCHRVIGSDGTLTGYGGGLWRKKWLLTHERVASTGAAGAGGELK